MNMLKKFGVVVGLFGFAVSMGTAWADSQHEELQRMCSPGPETLTIVCGAPAEFDPVRSSAADLIAEERMVTENEQRGLGEFELSGMLPDLSVMVTASDLAAFADHMNSGVTATLKMVPEAAGPFAASKEIPEVVPEPATVVLFGTALLGLVGFLRFRRTSR